MLGEGKDFGCVYRTFTLSPLLTPPPRPPPPKKKYRDNKEWAQSKSLYNIQELISKLLHWVLQNLLFVTHLEPRMYKRLITSVTTSLFDL